MRYWGRPIVLALIVLLATSSANPPHSAQAQRCEPEQLGWIALDTEATEGAAAFSQMKEETTSGLMVNFVIPGLYAQEVQVGNVVYQRLSLPGYATTTAVGQPEVPTMGAMVEVPFGVRLEVEVDRTYSRSITLECYNIYPAQEPVINAEVSPQVNFDLDTDAYQQDANQPGVLAYVGAEDVGIIRGHRVVFVHANPIQYNPRTKALEVYTNLEVRLNYTTGRRPAQAQVERVDPRLESPAFEEFLEASLLNYKAPERYEEANLEIDVEWSCDYLIITEASLYNASDPNDPIKALMDWKQRKGNRTCLELVGSISNGSNNVNGEAEDIQDYIQTMYDTYNRPPTYVLLIGDSELVPTNVGSVHPYSDYGGGHIGTDLYYATVDGDDRFPDIYIGRLPVDTPQQVKDWIEKLLAYERDPTTSTAFYSAFTSIAEFQDLVCDSSGCSSDDGQESRPWIAVSEDFLTYLGDEGHATERIYFRDSATSTPTLFHDGTALPAGLQWNGSAADISAAINGGRFLIAYNDHGARQGWGIGFDVSDADALANYDTTDSVFPDTLPMIFSTACEVGWFDNETDDAVFATPNTDESLIEHLMRNPNGGVAAVMSVRVSYSYYSDMMLLGFIKALWPNYAPGPHATLSAPEVDNPALYRLGQSANFSKFYMAQRYAHDDIRQAQFELYHLFGDPETQLWTDVPGDMDVGHPAFVGEDDQTFVVTVRDRATQEPLYNATVTLTNPFYDLIAVRQTDSSGSVRFEGEAWWPADLDLTVTLHNYRPYEGTITQLPGDLLQLDPDNGIAGQQVQVRGSSQFVDGTTVAIYFEDQLAARTAVANGQFVTDISIPSDAAFGPANITALEVNASGHTIAAHAAVFEVRSANPVDLYTYSQWDSSTWHLSSGQNPVWDSPDIWLQNSSGNSASSHELSVGENYSVAVRVHNDTQVDADGVRVYLKWANFGIGQDERVWETVGDNGQPVILNIPAGNTGLATFRWAPPSTGHLCLLADVYHPEDPTNGYATNNQGQENTYVGPTSSPATVTFQVCNPTDSASAVFLEVRQLPSDEELESGQRHPLWATEIGHPFPQLLQPGECREAAVTFDPDSAGVQSGGEARFAVTGFIGDRMIGGMTFTITAS